MHVYVYVYGFRVTRQTSNVVVLLLLLFLIWLDSIAIFLKCVALFDGFDRGDVFGPSDLVGGKVRDEVGKSFFRVLRIRMNAQY